MVFNQFNNTRTGRAKAALKGMAGYDNARENIDPHIKTKVINTKEILQNGVSYDLSKLSGAKALYLELSGGNANQAINIGDNPFTSSQTIRGGNIRSDGLTSARICLVGANGVLADNANIKYLQNDINLNGTIYTSGANITGNLTVSGGTLSGGYFEILSGNILVHDDDGVIFQTDITEGSISGHKLILTSEADDGISLDIHGGTLGTDSCLKITQGNTNTTYQKLINCKMISGSDVFLIETRGSDGVTRTTFGGNISTTAVTDLTGLRVLTSASAAQFMAFKAIFLGTSYAQATNMSGAAIRTQSTLPLLLQPKGTTTHTCDSTKEYLETGIKFGLGAYAPLDIFHLSGGGMALQNTSAPSYSFSGGTLFASGGALYFKGSQGTLTSLAVA